MSIPTMPESIWEQIKDEDPISSGSDAGCWDLDSVKVLVNSSGTWTLVALSADPDPKPQGRVLSGWSHIKEGELNTSENIITLDELDWQLHHTAGVELPGEAEPERA